MIINRQSAKEGNFYYCKTIEDSSEEFAGMENKGKVTEGKTLHRKHDF